MKGRNGREHSSRVLCQEGWKELYNKVNHFYKEYFQDDCGAFYRVISTIDASGHSFEGEWRAVKGSRYFESFDLYKENGFKTEEKAKELIAYLLEEKPIQCIVESVEKKKEKKNPPLLYNLAELQNDCSKRFKISPDEALRVVQELYEKKLVTYPRTDARVLSTAVAKEISRNLNGLSKYPPAQPVPPSGPETPRLCRFLESWSLLLLSEYRYDSTGLARGPVHLHGAVLACSTTF